MKEGEENTHVVGMQDGEGEGRGHLCKEAPSSEEPCHLSAALYCAWDSKRAALALISIGKVKNTKELVNWP